MEVYEYNLIALSPFIFNTIVLLITVFVVKRKDKGREFVEFLAFNVFPEIIKTKKDNNQVLVYLRQDKVLLEGQLLKNVIKALTAISVTVLSYAVGTFGYFAFIEYSYTCEQGKDCFLWPIKSDSALDIKRANCTDPAIVEGKKLVLCYKLVLHLEFAVGVTYRMYKVSKLLLSVGVTLITKINKNRIKCFQITCVLILFIAVVLVVVLGIVFNEHPSLRFSAGTLKIMFTSTLVSFTAVFFIWYFPWKDIIELKDNDNTREIGVANPANIPV